MALAEDRDDNLTTEGKMWEWMYGKGPPVYGATEACNTTSMEVDESMAAFFEPVRAKQECVFCKERLQNDGAEARCVKGHSFGKPIPSIPTYSCTNLTSPSRSHLYSLRTGHLSPWNITSMRGMPAKTSKGSRAIKTRYRLFRPWGHRPLTRGLVWWLRRQICSLMGDIFFASMYMPVGCALTAEWECEI